MSLNIIPSNSFNQCLAKTGMSSPVYLKSPTKRGFPTGLHKPGISTVRCLIFIIQAVSIKAKLPGGKGLVLIIQAIMAEIKPKLGSSISLGGKRSWGLIEMAGTYWYPWDWVWSLVQEAGDAEVNKTHSPCLKVGSWASISLTITWSLSIGHGIGPLHAGRGGDRDLTVGRWKLASDRHRSTAAENGWDWWC